MNFQKGICDNEIKYPLTKAGLKNLKSSKLVSPRAGKAHGLELPKRLSTLDGLNEAADEVLAVRKLVSQNQWPKEFLEKWWPADWGAFPDEMPKALEAEGLRKSNPKGAADIVHMDSPNDLGEALLGWLLSNGYKVKKAPSKFAGFLENVVEPLGGMGKFVADSLEKAFQAKYQFGLARPEEVISMFGAAKDFDVTYYKEGCPCHPSFPAGHGTAAGATGSFLIEQFDLDDDAIKYIRLACYLWAMFRTFAGVHFAEDNLAGLKLGGLVD